MIIKRGIDYRILTEPDPSNTNDYYFILEIRNSIFGIKYWFPVMVDTDLDKVINETRRLKKKYK